MLNPRLHKNPLTGKRKSDPDTLYKGLIEKDFSALSQAITLVESTEEKDRETARILLDRCLQNPPKKDSFRLGITGVPGVGKSTFIEKMGLQAIEKGYQVAVLAIDPSSATSKGSILGDKTRMQELSVHPQAFIRPSASGLHLGGVARSTRETIILCEMAGFDFIVIETVGVGQSEIEVFQLTDFFLLLMLAGAGDELQGIKRGIMEMADALFINKADGDNERPAKRAAAEYRRAIHLMPPHPGEWVVPVDVVSALENTGVSQLFDWLDEYRTQTEKNNYWTQKRQKQAIYWFEQSLQQILPILIKIDDELNRLIRELKKAVSSLQTSPFQASEQILHYLKHKILSSGTKK